MKVSDFDYELPAGQIAQRPASRRDHARLMVVGGGAELSAEPPRPPVTEEFLISDLPGLLSPGDLVVLNDTRVFPARLRGRKESGGRIEVLLLSRTSASRDGRVETWRALLGSSRMPDAGQGIDVGEGLQATVIEPPVEGRALLSLESGEGVASAVERLGQVPLPPYIERPDGPEQEDRERYQTVFARHSGAAAAPTAGLHFTRELLERLESKRIRRAALTLHVGLGTFQPLRGDALPGRIHSEFYRIPESTARAVDETHRAGGRVVAVGTTVVRALEFAGRGGQVVAGEGWCDLFIAPGFPFRQTDLLLTNFHLPRSTLLMLVSAFAGRERVLACYREAIRRGYRFYSYGDAMLLEREAADGPRASPLNASAGGGV
ncbi:MAG: tRNA preQ1(34) S-adenosylmethionine ribosyltransferase-isomerase QueA [Acidobacteria bacterium]|nr:MAG: tRNA preQ1(34) S-adenosylmethionine ribosyltransferase-isomerase QueA [Acidobacteriota bacterium]